MPDAGGSERPPDRDRSSDATSARPDVSLGVAVVTISAERTIETDEPTAEIVRALEAAHHEITVRERIDSTHDAVQATISRLVDRDDVELIVTAGSTGIDPSDVTIEAVRPIIDRDLPTFCQLFARRVADRIGSRAIAGRTEAGIVDGVPVFCLPGNADATTLATEELIGPEAGRLVAEARGESIDADESIDEE